MKMTQFMKRLVERTFGVKIYRSTLPHGTDMIYDMERRFGRDHFRCIFDVGANIGLTAQLYSDGFPLASIWAFEPVADTFRQLQKNVAHLDRVKAIQYALGGANQEIEMNVSTDLQTSSLRTCRPEDRKDKVVMHTLDSFCAKSAIERIHLLKIDVEGYELEVLKGADAMFQSNAVDLVLFEASPELQSNYFVTYGELMAAMNRHGYELFGIYDQQPHWNGRASLLHFNLLYVSGRLLRALS